MKIEREVILDLLPVYLSGEASTATRALVEEHLRQDPELARWVREQGAEALPKAGPAPPPELELRSLVRTRRLLGVQKWLFALAISCTAIAFALKITFQDSRITEIRFVILDRPLELGIVLAIAIVFWAGYYAVGRRLRSMAV